MNRGQLILVILIVLLACGGLAYFGIPALQSALPKATSAAATPDYEATVQARLTAAAPTPVAQATPNIEATVQARLTTSAPRPTTIPTAAAPAATSAPSSGGAASACKTDSEVMDLFGFPPGEIVRTDAPWDSCKWNRQVAISSISFTLIQGWGLTYTDPNGNVWVTIGKGQKVTVRGFTLRQPGNQFLALGPQGYFDKEWQFGYAPERGSRTYPHCPDADIAALVSLTADQSQKCAAQGTKSTGGVVAPTSVVVSTGPSDPTYNWNANCFNKDWLSTNIGGAKNNWNAPDWDGGAAVYLSKGTFVPLKYPGTGKLVVWIGSGPVEITGANAGLLNGKTFDEASFHCK